jgi:glycosyltransferase involved in cell wall biosynthesis
MNIPFVSVVMPVRNEAPYIARSLGAVLAQDYPSERMEVIVADGMSTDGTQDIIRSFQAQHPHLRLIDNADKIVSKGLNRAIRQASGEIIVRVDGHCEIGQDYIQRCVKHLQSDGISGVGGPLETVGATPIARVIAVAMSSRFGVGGCAFRVITNKTMLTDTIPFPAYTRTILEIGGPFDEELVRNQDDEYNYRLRKLGAKLLLAADVQSRYYSRSSLRSLWRQYFEYGYWKVRVLQKHPCQMRPRQFVPPAFVAALLGTGILACFFGLGRVSAATVVGVYLLANLVASIGALRRENWHELLLLPIVFATLHLSYGSGFLVGLIRFRNRWRDRRCMPQDWLQQPCYRDNV